MFLALNLYVLFELGILRSDLVWLASIHVLESNILSQKDMRIDDILYKILQITFTYFIVWMSIGQDYYYWIWK